MFKVFRKTGQPFLVVCLGLIFLFFLLETSLYLLGLGVEFLRNRENRRSFSGPEKKTIVCFGESMTFRRYPKVLEKMLNDKYAQGSFFVVDEGLSRTRSNYIVNIFDSVIDREQPLAVVIMTGLGDDNDKFFARASFETMPFLYRIRTVRLFVLLAPIVRGALNGFFVNQESGTKISSGPVNETKLFDDAALDDECWKPVHVLVGQGKAQEAFLLFEKLYARFPEKVDLKNDYLFIMEKIYGPVAAGDKLEKMADKMFALIEQGEWEKDWVCVALDFWLNAAAFCENPQLRNERVRKFVAEKKAQYPEFADNMDMMWDNVANIVEKNKRNEGFVETEPRWMCREDVRRLLRLNKPDLLKKELNAYLKKLIDDGAPDNDFRTQQETAGVLGASGIVSLMSGNLSGARDFFGRAGKIRGENICQSTCANIRFLARHALERGILPVFVQYPVRSVEPLRRMLAPFAGKVVIVDNERSFKNAVAEKGFCYYFEDSFAWDFGHTTKEGDRLLAGNIMRALEKQLKLEEEK